METKDWIQVGSVIALILGWFVNGALNRRNEIAKKRLDFILPTLKSFSQVWYKFQQQPTNKEYIKELETLLMEVREDFHLFGSERECNLFEMVIKYGIGQNRQPEKAEEAINELRRLVRDGIRKELRIKN